MQELLVIIGAGGHGKVVADVALHTNEYQKLVFLDDKEDFAESMGIPVIGKVSDAVKFVERAKFIVAIGNANTRKEIMQNLLDRGAEFATLIHPDAVIGKNVRIGKGTVIMAGAVVNPETIIGNGCIINTCASVDHDCSIADYVHISVGAHIAGTVRVGRLTWIGMGAIVSNNIKICEGCTFGAGTVVIDDIEESETYVGIPARRILREYETNSYISQQ